MANDAVWMTGVGMVTPLGHSFQEVGGRLFAGQSGIERVDSFDVSQHPSQIAAQVKTIPVPTEWTADSFTTMPRLNQCSLWCTAQALKDAGLWESRHRLRIGIVLGVGAEWGIAWENDFYQDGQQIHDGNGESRSLVQQLRHHLQLSGPVHTVSAACASGNIAFAVAKRWLENDWVDVCLAGACDMTITPMSLAGFGNLRALSRRNDEPQAASRPFDKDRDGFVAGEGGVVFLLEKATSARKRNAHCYAAVAGLGMRSDAYHMVIPSPHPEPAVKAMQMACSEAQIDPQTLDYVNCHATSTPVGDQAEARVLHQVLGSAVDRIPVSSTKSMTGHMLTAAAAFEALACVLALERQAVPPTINLDHPDTECQLCHVPWTAQSRQLRVVASNSFGFGGSNTCLVLKAA